MTKKTAKKKKKSPMEGARMSDFGLPPIPQSLMNEIMGGFSLRIPIPVKREPFFNWQSVVFSFALGIVIGVIIANIK